MQLAETAKCLSETKFSHSHSIDHTHHISRCYLLWFAVYAWHGSCMPSRPCHPFSITLVWVLMIPVKSSLANSVALSVLTGLGDAGLDKFKCFPGTWEQFKHFVPFNPPSYLSHSQLHIVQFPLSIFLQSYCEGRMSKEESISSGSGELCGLLSAPPIFIQLRMGRGKVQFACICIMKNVSLLPRFQRDFAWKMCGRGLWVWTIYRWE